MIVVEKNTGDKIPYEVSGTTICFDDDLSLNLAKRQQDWDVHIDVCYNANKELVIGTAAGRSYVAEVDIPAAEYTSTGEGDDQTQEKAALDMDDVTLTLWAI